MKKNLFLILLVLFFGSVNAQKKGKPFLQNDILSYTEFHAPVPIIKKGMSVDGFVEGECRGYLKDKKSTLVLVEHYKKGKWDGQFIQYYPNGRVYGIGFHKMDTLLYATTYDTIGFFSSTSVYSEKELPDFNFTYNLPNSFNFYFNDTFYYEFDSIKKMFIKKK